MRKRGLISVVCVVAILFSALAVPLEATAAMITAPKTITNVSYKYNDWVKFMDLSKAKAEGESVRIPGTSLSKGDIVVDKMGLNSLKVVQVNSDGSYITTRPTMYELFSEFEIPRQIIEPNEANITEYGIKGIYAKDYVNKWELLENLETQLSEDDGEGYGWQTSGGDSSSADDGNSYMTLSDVDKLRGLFNRPGSRLYEFDGGVDFTPFSGGPSVKVNLRGAVGVSPGIVARYSLNDGYEFGFVDAAQLIDLQANVSVNIKQELYCPLIGITVGIKGLGAVNLGVFLVLNVDGEISLVVKAQEGITASVSVSGKTKWGVPKSFNLNRDFNFFYGAECDPMGRITAGIYLTPSVTLEILSIDVFEAELRLGFYAYAGFSETTLNYGIDFVLHAFVAVVDERIHLIGPAGPLRIPIIERSKTMRKQDDVIFYSSRLCNYQDRINIAAFTKLKAGTSVPDGDPFTDKLPFKNRPLEVWYYASGNDPQEGHNQNPTEKIYVKTDENGCVTIDFSNTSPKIDVSKGDAIIIKAVGFNGQTDIIRSTPPFGRGGWGYGPLQGDFFNETVKFLTLSGPDLTGLDVPNTEISFKPKKRIYYNGPVFVYSTDVDTNVTEEAIFYAKPRDDVEKYPLKPMKNGAPSSGKYDIKPNHRMTWQILTDGYTYGSDVASGKDGFLTEHPIAAHSIVTDQKVPIRDYDRNLIGWQHNITLGLIAVNKEGSKPYLGKANLDLVALGEVPAGYEQGPWPVRGTELYDFPAADFRWPGHFEYHPESEFPITHYQKTDVSKLVLGSPEPSPEGTSTEDFYRWRWERIKPDIPEFVTTTDTETIYGPDGGLIGKKTVKVNESNIRYDLYDAFLRSALDPEFEGMEPACVVTSLGAAASDTWDFDPYTRDIFQMRHKLSGLEVEGVPIPIKIYPPYPMPKRALESEQVGTFSFEALIENLLTIDRYVINPFDRSAYAHSSLAAIDINRAVKNPVAIKNAAALPAWAAGYINSTVNNGIMSLDNNGNFPAGKHTTRAEFCAAIVNALGLTSLDTVREGFPFGDIGAGDANLKQMQTAYQCGIINGTSETTFSPNDRITRQDASAMLIRAFSLRNTELIPEGTAGMLGRFSDKGSVSGYATDSFEKSIALNFFGGYPNGTLMPTANILNEQTAKIVWELKLRAEKPGKQWDM